MKHLLLALLILLSSCSYSSYQLKTNCKVSNQVLFERLTGALVQNGFQIKTTTNAYLSAETSPISDRYGINHVHVWIIAVSNDTVTAKAKEKVSSGDWNNEGEKSDNIDKSATWYWSIRAEIEEVCGNKVILIETKK